MTSTKTDTKFPKLEILHGRQTTEDYPYGRLRCTRHTDLEFKKGKGWRIAHTTINPKTGRVNNPKRSTYHSFMQLHKEPETGYTKALFFGINGRKEINTFRKFLETNGDQLQLTDEESQELWSTIITSFRIGASWASDPISYLEEAGTKQMIKLYGNHMPITEILTIPLDLEKLNSYFTR